MTAAWSKVPGVLGAAAASLDLVFCISDENADKTVDEGFDAGIPC
jgi:hypothetical protein